MEEEIKNSRDPSNIGACGMIKADLLNALKVIKNYSSAVED